VAAQERDQRRQEHQQQGDDAELRSTHHDDLHLRFHFISNFDMNV
jgi:hypothetical protein